MKQVTAKRARLALVAIAALLSVACSSTPQQAMQPPPTPWPTQAQLPPASAGSLYSAHQHMSLFKDQRARQIGDIITISLVEQTNASKQSSTSTNKDSDLSIGAGTLLGRAVTNNGIPVLNNQLDSGQSFSGEGSSSQSNSLSGQITVVVQAVMPNGNLMVAGEKWLTINQGEELIRVSGIIRPVDIGPDNTVSSFKLADARITYSGRGALADANRMGWLNRVFQSAISPF